MVELGVAVLVFALFLWSVHGLLNPFLLFWLLVAALHPFRGRPGHASLVGVAALLTFLWVLDFTGFLLAPFFVALILAYLFDPVVDRLSAGRIPRTGAILLLAVPLVGAFALLLFIGVPAVVRQVSDLVQAAPEFLERMAVWIQTMPERLIGTDLPWVDEDALATQIRSVDGAAVIEFLSSRQDEIVANALDGVLGLGRGLGSLLAVVGYVVLTPVLTFYLLRDYDEITRRIATLLPERRRAGITQFAIEFDHLLGRYLRGQFTVAFLVGGITAVGLWLWGFPYAFLLGVIVAVLGFVPYVGLVLSLIPAIVIALFSGLPGAELLPVVVVYAGAQALEATVISPRIVGDSVGLHPVWVVLALAISGYFFGFVGLLLAVPLAVGVKLLVVRSVERYRNSGVYRRSPTQT